MTRFRATLSYDGTPFNGFQRQTTGLPTVQATLEEGLQSVMGEAVKVDAAGRTDTGVHAIGQVVAFDCNWKHTPNALERALNVALPTTLAVRDVSVTRATFHPRWDALTRAYRYTIALSQTRMPLWNERAWVVYYDLDLGLMSACARQLIGRHDFAAFGLPPQGSNTVRTVMRAEWQAQSIDGTPFLIFEIVADAFLYRMVRRTVGMLVDVGRGKQSALAFEQMLTSPELAQGVTVAPAHGLVLTHVTYPDEETSVASPQAIDKASETLLSVREEISRDK
ncbi:MAG: tRNA pseudouridine(38-40) synthase TruA [Phototrophicaceae bacterium]